MQKKSAKHRRRSGAKKKGVVPPRVPYAEQKSSLFAMQVKVSLEQRTRD